MRSSTSLKTLAAITLIAGTIGILVGCRREVMLSRPGDPAAVLDIALRAVETKSSSTFELILSQQLPQEFASAARELRRITPPEAVPHTPGYTLPRGYLVLREVHVQPEAVLIVGTLGPVPAETPGKLLLACGDNYLVYVERGLLARWRVKELALMRC